MNDQSDDRQRYLRWSYGLLALALLSILVTDVLLDAALAPLSLMVQRILVFITHVLPTLAGALAGLLALRQPGARRFLAVGGIVLNAFVAVFFIALLGIAG